MARALLTVILLLTLTGCETFGKTKVEYITVCPEPPFIERPELDVLHLREGDTPDTVIQSHRVTIKKLQKWGLEQEVILDGYRKNKESK